jgi:hypothetical protein
MPKRLTFFKNLTPYYIKHQSIEGRQIFVDEIDCQRFIYQIYAANFGSPLNLSEKRLKETTLLLFQGKESEKKILRFSQPPLVYLLSFALLKDSFHFILAQRKEGGISKFMQKLCGGFVKYFNSRHQRSGPLFAGRFFAFPLEKKEELREATLYINLSPLLIDFKKEENPESWLTFLKNFNFCSFPDFIGIRKSYLLPPQNILKMFYPKDDLFSEKTYEDLLLKIQQEKLNLKEPSWLQNQ